MFLCGAAVMTVLLVLAVLRLPPVGARPDEPTTNPPRDEIHRSAETTHRRTSPPLPHHGYGDTLTRLALARRHVTNATTAVIFDFRGIDTLGEEFVLFTATAGVVLLLRRGEKSRRKSHVAGPVGADVRLGAYGAIPLTLVFGIYLALNGHLGMGGGFQGGVVLFDCWMIYYVVAGSEAYHRAARDDVADLLEGAAAAGFALVGLSAVATGAAFLTNVLPFGRLGDLLSGGTIPVIDSLVAIEVAAALIVIFTQFVQQLERPQRSER